MTDSPIPSMGKVWNFGHGVLENLFVGPVVAQEKIDGSQISWMSKDGALHVRSKGAVIYPETVAKTDMFYPSVQTLVAAFGCGALADGVIYRGEAMRSAKHNTIAYERAPHGHIVLFDVELPDGEFGDLSRVAHEAAVMGIEAVPYFDVVASADGIRGLLQRESVLGHALIEGVVVKNYHQYDYRTGKILMGKLVSEAFKESHKREWKTTNPTKLDVVEHLIEELRQPTRWAKAVQHLRERGELEGSPRDIGPLMAEAKKDLAEEEAEYIAGRLLEWALPKIQRGATGGLAEWYKNELLEGQFS